MATSAHLMFGTTGFAEISWLSAFDHRCGNDWSTEATFRLACTGIGPGLKAILIGIPSAHGSVIRMCWSAIISSNGRWVFLPKHLRASMDSCALVGPPRTPVSLSERARLTGSTWSRGHPAKQPQYGHGARPFSGGVRSLRRLHVWVDCNHGSDGREINGVIQERRSVQRL